MGGGRPDERSGASPRRGNAPGSPPGRVGGRVAEEQRKTFFCVENLLSPVAITFALTLHEAGRAKWLSFPALGSRRLGFQFRFLHFFKF